MYSTITKFLALLSFLILMSCSQASKLTGALTNGSTNDPSSIPGTTSLPPTPSPTPLPSPVTSTLKQIFNYPNGFTNAASNFTVSGGSQGSFSGSQMLVTNGVPGRHEAGGIWYNTPQNIQSFTTDFTFQMPDTVGVLNNIDGMTFCIQNSNTTTNPNDQYGPHSGLHAGTDANVSGYGAYIPLGQYGIGNSVAIKFEEDSDSNWQHPFIPVLDPGGGTYNGTSLVDGYSSVTGLYMNGGPSAGLVPQIDLNPFGIQLGRGHVMAAHVVYDGAVLTMTLQDTASGNQARLSWPIDIPAIVGASSAYIGFTSGEIDPNQNKVLSWTFNTGLAPKLSAPTLNIASGTYSNTQSISLHGPSGASVYYTTNGQAPTVSSNLYSSPITISSNEIIQAVSIEAGYTDSDVTIGNYQIGTSNIINLANFSNASGLVTLNGSARFTNSQLQLTDANNAYSTGASLFEVASAWYAVPVTITKFTTQFVLQFPGAANAGMTFAIQNQPPASYASNLPASYPTAVTYSSTPSPVPTYLPKNFLYVSGGPNALGNSGDGYSGFDVTQGGQIAGFYSSIALKFESSSTGLYENGVSRDTVSLGSVNLNSATPITVTLNYDGTTLSMTATQGSNTFSHGWPVNIPADVAGSTAYIGFTAADGVGGYGESDQRVTSWTYSATK